MDGLSYFICWFDVFGETLNLYMVFAVVSACFVHVVDSFIRGNTR